MNTFNGSEREFEELVNTHKAAVYGTAYAYFRYNSEIDDVVQETFIHAYFNYGTIKDQSKIGAWLCGVARNIALKKLRGTRFHLSLDTITELGTGNLENKFIRKETNDEIHKAIASLSKPIAETTTLYYFSGKKIHEISLLLSVAEGTVKSRLHDSRKKLKGALIHMMKNEGINISKKNIATEVRALLRQATESSEKSQTAVALAQCDKAISALVKSEDEYKTLAEIYRVRAYVNHNRNEEMLEDSERSIQYARLSGDERLITECLLSLAFDYNTIDKKFAAFSEAYTIANRIRYNEVCSECAFWIGTIDIQCGNYENAEKHFESSLEHYTHINLHSNVNCCSGDSVRTHAFATAALNSMKMLADVNRLDGNYISLNSFCQLLRVNDDGIKTDNNYGWDIPGKQSRPRFYHRFWGKFEVHKVLTSVVFDEKNNLDYEYYTYNGVLIKQHYTVVSRNEDVAVPAGSFTNCLHIRVTEEIPNFESENEMHREANEDLSVCDYWFVENIGEIKAFISYPNEHNDPIPSYYTELKAYTVSPSSEKAQKYFPLIRGNKWEYVCFNKNHKPYSDMYNYRDCYEVDLVLDGYAYIANCGHAFTV